MMHEEPQAVTLARLEIAVERLIAVVMLQEEKMKAVLELLFEEDSVANLASRFPQEADMGMLEAIREVYLTPGRYVPQIDPRPSMQKEEEHGNED